MLTYKAKVFIFLVSFCCAVVPLIILSSMPWTIYSIKQHNRYTSAKSDSVNFKHSSAENDSTIFKQRKYKLVDVPQMFSDVGSIYNNSQDKSNSFKILWYNKPLWFGGFQEACNRNINRCFHGNCIVTNNKSLLNESDAVIFDVSGSSFPKKPPLTPAERDPNQVWIFYGLESPVHYHNKHFRRSEWRSAFNWTMTYRLDSDIPHPHTVLWTNNNPSQRDYRAIFRAKKKFAAWIVSHCHAVSRRDDFVRLLQKYIPVDIFGRCGTKNCSNEGTKCRDSVGKEYKFYLSFENSLCKDYITEKFFAYFPLDLITVQRGYSNYDVLLPNDTYINTANFATVKDLANFMTRLAEDEDQYIRYLKSKDRYVPKTFTYFNALCNICEKLNNLDKYKKSYIDILTWLERNICIKASDIR